MSQDERALALIREADKKLKGGWLSSLMGNNRIEEAADLYLKAANIYKMSKKWEEAADTFKKAASCHMQAQSPHDAASAHVNAANCLKKVNVTGSTLILRFIS